MRSLLTRVLATTLLLASLTGVQAQEREITIANEGGFPPFNMTAADGTLQGFDIDLGNAMCEIIKAKCNYVTNEWSGIIPALLAKKFDVIIGGMGITDERRKRVIFSEPYARTYSYFGVVEGKEFDISPETMKNKVIGIQQGTTNAAYVEKTYPGVEIRRYPSMDALISDLKAGRVDVVLGDIEPFLGKGDEKPKMVNIGDPVQVSEGIGMAFRPEDTALRDEFNAALQTLRDNGKWEELAKKWGPPIK
ncbi:transporter substrate-binding domain-containing protein [Mesorhizobium sp. BAC0120]|uniref:transporter substrate-binding domain-containing protein n=1 Tax=Mesorhizobium sp. BAC0120 TaxID=3090670 RepID=UPI00298BCDFD|nr:transporter substrate-binding domain-containing protein [Mesorhizobium sp. BAC0120]MDW6023306.1 transporter substrate-binding domain-containing protein [Mesorhizobium sp. BAC0120]